MNSLVIRQNGVEGSWHWQRFSCGKNSATPSVGTLLGGVERRVLLQQGAVPNSASSQFSQCLLLKVGDTSE